MKIVLVTETLQTGGAETFVVRLANSLVKNHEVSVINLHPNLSKAEVIKQLDVNINLININIPFKNIVLKLDGLLRKARFNISFIESLNIHFLKNIISKILPDVVHSHLFNCDFYVAVAKRNGNLKFNHVSTNHGDYLICQTTKISNKYIAKRNFTLGSMNYLVNISDEQMQWSNELKSANILKAKYKKILNGYINKNVHYISRGDLNIPEEAFVYGMVARGIKEKGWKQLIEAFKYNAIDDTFLVLVGEGPEITILKQEYGQEANIRFIGFSDNPVVYINLFDVGTLPSYYKAESLPTVIIEYLYCNKAVIASDIGEVKNMISTSDGLKLAGELINNYHQPVSVELLADIMRKLYLQESYY